MDTVPKTTTTGVLLEAWHSDGKLVPVLRQDMTPVERRETVREVMRTVGKGKNRLDLVSSEMLYEVTANRYWKEWKFVDHLGEERPYASFEEYAQEECDISLRTARSLVAVYKKYVLEFGLDREDVIDLEWTKAELILRVVTKENVKELLEKIKEMSQNEVRTMVRHMLHGEDEDSSEEGVVKAKDEDEDEKEKLVSFRASLAPSQAENVLSALELAQSMSGSDKVGNNLDLICTDFQSGNAGKGARGALTRLDDHIQNLQRTFGVQLEITDFDREKYAKLEETKSISVEEEEDEDEEDIEEDEDSEED